MVVVLNIEDGFANLIISLEYFEQCCSLVLDALFFIQG